MIYQNQVVDWPLDSNIIRRNSESHTFGMVRNYSDGTPKPHQGWDLFAPVGTPCFSIADGEVIFSGPRGDLGLVIILHHRKMNIYSVYAHLDKLDVERQDFVKLGQQIGLTGNSGNAEKMQGKDQHLHFEIRLEPYPGLGLGGRISPLTVFRKYPLTMTQKREAL